MKILVTGGSGLLGADIAGVLEAKSKELSVEKVIRQRFSSSEGFLVADLTSREGLNAIAEQEWDVIVHAAANKDPDSCEKDKAGTDALNVHATKFLAGEALKRGAYFVYICTDYVFPGTNPPYNENSKPHPVNYYGISKLHGEQEVLKASDQFCSLRVPILYGVAAGVKHSAVISSSLSMLLDPSEKVVDDAIVRYPTYTGDVAEAVALLIKKRGSGIFHCTGINKSTKYQICVDIAEAMGLSHAHVKPLNTAPPSIAQRPHDCHLEMERLKKLGFPPVSAFKEHIEFFKDEISAYIAKL